jgi:hypothetical protein
VGVSFGGQRVQRLSLVEVQKGVVAVGNDARHVVAKLLKFGPVYYANGTVSDGSI